MSRYQLNLNPEVDLASFTRNTKPSPGGKIRLVFSVINSYLVVDNDMSNVDI